MLHRSEISHLIKRKGKAGTSVEEKIRKLRKEKEIKDEEDSENEDDEVINANYNYQR